MPNKPCILPENTPNKTASNSVTCDELPTRSGVDSAFDHIWLGWAQHPSWSLKGVLSPSAFELKNSEG